MNVPEGQPRSPYSGKPIAGDLEPFDLFASDGEKVGTVVEVNDEFLVVQHGGFLGLGESHGRIPRSLVSTGDEDGWYLSVDQDRAKATLENEGLYTPAEGEEYATPSGATGQTTTYGETTPYEEETTQYGDRTQATAGYPSAGASGETMRTYEEGLRADTTTREAGEVVARKEVVEETETIDVPVKREEVHVERRPASDTGTTGTGTGTASGEARFQEDEVHIPVMEEEVHVQKVARPTEDVTISKEQVQETERVSGTVRKEHVEIDDEAGRR